MPPKKNPAATFANTLKHLQDENSALSSTVLAALSGIVRPDLARFAQTWSKLSPERRRAIAQRLVELAEDDFKLDFDLLFRYWLDDEDAQVRTAGIEGLWESEDAALVQPMIGFLRSDPDALVRAAAAAALGRFMLLAEYGRLHDDQAQIIGEALLATTRSDLEDLTLRCRAVEALAYWSNDIVRTVIETAYEDDAPEMRASAVAAMGRSADAHWRQIAQDELESLDPRMRFEAVRAAGELEIREATDRLIELLDDDDRQVQGAAVLALGQIGGKTAKAALTHAAQSDDEMLSVLANDALEELGFVEGSDLLLFDLERDDESDADEDNSSAEEP